jgi:hypothetical protein
MRSYPMRRPGVPACVTLEAGTLGVGTLGSGTLGSGTLGSGTLGHAAGRIGAQTLGPGACRAAAEPGIRPVGRRFDWAAARAAKRAAKREARAASPRAGTGTTCEIRSDPVQPPARPAPVPAEAATGRPCPLAPDPALAPGACPRAAEPGACPRALDLRRCHKCESIFASLDRAVYRGSSQELQSPRLPSRDSRAAERKVLDAAPIWTF